MIDLTLHHRRQLYQSTLTDATIAAARIATCIDPREAARVLNWESADGPVTAIALPVFVRGGQQDGYVLRPDTPRRRPDGRMPKYEVRKGAPPRPYFPPPALIDPAWYMDVAVPLFFTEGTKKALAVTQLMEQMGSLAPISVHGVDLLHDVAHRDATGQWRLHPDILALPLRGRIVYLAFDGGDTSEKPGVIRAEAQGGRLLLDAGADVRLVRMPFVPGGPKIGVDDYLFTQEDRVVALQGLLDHALVADPLVRARAVGALDGAQRADAAAELLRDLSFAAALRVGGNATKDLVAHELRNTGIRPGSLQGVARRFDEMLAHQRERAADDAQGSARGGFTPEIEAEADQLLRDPQLIGRYLRGLAAEGVVGESDASVVLLLVVVTRKTRRPVHAAVKAASASGKNFVTARVASRLPSGDVVFVTDVSPRALQYLNHSMKGKVFIIAEQEGAERAEYTLRIAMSEGSLSILVAEKVESGDGSRIETREHKVEGPACFITTTTRATLNDENETRVLEVTLDESQDQTRRIIRAQAERAAHPPNHDELEAQAHEQRVWQCALGKLEFTETINPCARELVEQFPDKHIRARRDFQRVLDLSSASALLHQRQRQVDGGRVVVDRSDVRLARELCDPLYSTTPPRLKSLAERLRAQFSTAEFTTAQAAAHLGYSPDAMRRALGEMEGLELVRKVQESRGSKAAKWRTVPPQSPATPLPTPLVAPHPVTLHAPESGPALGTLPDSARLSDRVRPWAGSDASGRRYRNISHVRPSDRGWERPPSTTASQVPWPVTDGTPRKP